MVLGNLLVTPCLSVLTIPTTEPATALLLLLLQVLGLKLSLKRRDPHYFLPTTGALLQSRAEQADKSVPSQQAASSSTSRLLCSWSMPA
jgi:hypothetical protein